MAFLREESEAGRLHRRDDSIIYKATKNGFAASNIPVLLVLCGAQNTSAKLRKYKVFSY